MSTARAAKPDPAMGLIDVEAERILLGSILRYGACTYSPVLETGLQPEHFGIVKHRLLFQIFVEMMSAGRELGIGEIANVLDMRGQLSQVDGLGGLTALDENVVRGNNVVGFAQVVYRKALHRRAFAVNEEIGKSILAAIDPDEICRQAGELQNVYASFRRKPHGETFEECLAEVGGFDKLLSPPEGLVPFAFEGSPVCGFGAGQLVTIGGRPSMGKTILGCHVAIHSAGLGFKTLLLSLEMSKDQMLRRLISMVGRINHSDLQSGRSTALLREAVLRTGARIADWSLRIVTEPTTLRGIGSKIAGARREGHPYQLVVIDYLGLIQTGNRFENRTAEVSHISRTLKRLAMQNEVPIVALAQLNRAPESRRGSHEPQLSDLRDSGAIEQDSDVVAFVHRPGFYKPKDKELRNEARLIVAKNRNGPIGTLDLVFIPEFVMFCQPSGEQAPEQMEVPA